MDQNQIAIAYGIYYATGEGMTVFIALAASAQHAERIYRESVDEYFHPCMAITQWGDSSEDLEFVKPHVPAAVIELLAENPPGSTEHFCRTHWNLS